MAIPVIPAIVAWLLSLVGSVVGFFASVFTARVALATAGVAGIIALALILKTALDTAMSGLLVAYPGGYWATGLGLLPDNVNECIGAIIAARLAAWIYAWKVQLIRQYTGG